MATERARLLLHPVRMRVVIALSAQELTTHQIHRLMPEVPQASLYRAISQLARAGVLEVVSEERRGGAMERTYRLTPGDAPLTPEELGSSSAAEVLGAVQTLADLMVAGTSRYLAATGEDWSQSDLTVRHASVWLTDEDREQLREDMIALVSSYEGRSRRDSSRLYSVQVSAVPDVFPCEVEGVIDGDPDRDLDGEDHAPAEPEADGQQ